MKTSRRDFLRTTSLGTAALLLTKDVKAAPVEQPSPNVLFLIVDDLRPQLGCYGWDWMKTPNLDRLAESGTLFERAYSQFPICGPSRCSSLTSLRPTKERFHKWNARVDEDVPGALTLPQHFQTHGYFTQSLGKVFHDLDDCEHAWTGGSWIPKSVLGSAINSYVLEENRQKVADKKMGPPTEAGPVDDNGYGDAWIAGRAVDEIRKLSKEKRPFFLSVGFLRPHLPFTAPQAYWDLYKEGVPLASNAYPPKDIPKEAMHNWEELRKYAGMPKEGPVSKDQAMELSRGYAASVSYVDSQIGRVVNELDALGIRKNTIIVLLADHGWQVGEHGLWAKHTLFETALHCPLIFSGPGVKANQRASGLVEYLDVYPTLCELTGLPIPDHVQGASAGAIVRDAATPGKDAVFSRHGIGESIKTDKYRYSEWYRPDGSVQARALFDHRKDPGENANVAEDPANASIVEDLSKRLREAVATA